MGSVLLFRDAERLVEHASGSTDEKVTLTPFIPTPFIPAKQSKPADTDFPLHLLEFLVSGDEVGFAVLRERAAKQSA